MPSIGSRGRRGGRDRSAAGADRLLAFLPPIAFLLYALTVPGLTRGDAAGVYATAAALVEGGAFAIDGATAALAPAAADAGAARSGPLAYAAGHYYHNVPPGPALLAAPLYALGLTLAPLLGPEVPAVLVGLLGPLLGALTVAGLARVLRRWGAALAPLDTVLLSAAGAIFLLPWVRAPAAPIVAAALACWLLPSPGPLWRGRATPPRAGLVGLGLASSLLLDYGLGLLAGVAIFATLARLRRAAGAAVALLASALLPVLVLAAYATVAFGQPWRPAFLFAVDAGRPRFDLLRPAVVAAVCAPLAVALAGALATRAARTRPARARPIRLAALALVFALTPWPILAALAGRRDAVVLPFDWSAPGALLPLLAVAAILVLAALLGIVRPGGARRRGGAAVPATILLVMVGLVGSGVGRAVSAAAPDGEGYAAPFAIATGGRLDPVWTVAPGTRFDDPQRLPLAAGGRAVSPWIDVDPGAAYRVRLDHTGPLRVLFAWEDLARRPLVQQAAEGPAGGALDAQFAAPIGAAGLRLHLIAGGEPATVANPRLTLARGARVEPFPDYRRAALAFSFDWESAMGGLIHSRSGAAGPGGTTAEGERVALGADGAPSVAGAEAKARRMREGADFLAGEFARHDIRATYYATGYNLLPGNPACEKFLGDPIYPNADTRNGWGSDYWKTHRWFEHDPCATEAAAPAWYFASQTRELAAAGHEIASHTFGHLYVRGVEPEQLAADLALWDRAARALGLPPSYSFAFPWTSSNSLDDRFFAVFERRGIVVLTRLYPLDLRHPYELDRVRGHPDLAVFPDGYLPSTPEAQDAALAGIDQTLARRGYHSLWTHPNEALEQGGPIIWPRVIAHAAAARERGLWIAPVAEIARYGLATRQVAVTALPVAGGTRLTVENRSDRRLDGLTLALPAAGAGVTIDGRASTDARGNQVRLPPLEPGGRVVVTARR